MAIGQFMPIIRDVPIPFSYEYNGSFSSSTQATTVTIPGVSLGRPSPKRVVVIGVGTRRSGSTSITAATIAGVAADVRNSVGTNASAHLVWAALPSGALGDVVISL